MSMKSKTVSDTMTVVDLGALIKRRALSIDISYGSGGYCVIVKHSSGTAHGYSWDIVDALNKSLAKLDENELKEMLSGYIEADDEPTHPDFRIDKIVK